MTKADHTSATRSTTTKQHRQLKVKQGYYDYQSRQQYKQRAAIGEISLKGKWLVEAGFKVNQPVTVRISQGCLVITPK